MKKSLLTCLLLLTPLLCAVAASAQTLQKVKVVIPQNSVFILNWLGARDAGVFRKHGIDLEVDARPFAAFLAALPAKECLTSTYSGIDAVAKMNELRKLSNSAIPGQNKARKRKKRTAAAAA